MTCPFPSKEIVAIEVSPGPVPEGKVSVRMRYCCPRHSPDTAWEDFEMRESDAEAFAMDLLQKRGILTRLVAKARAEGLAMAAKECDGFADEAQATAANDSQTPWVYLDRCFAVDQVGRRIRALAERVGS